MSFLTRLFKKKEIKEEAKEDNILNPDNSIIKEVKEIDGRHFIEDSCGLCKREIGLERWSKVKGFYVHRTCFKQKKKEMMNGG